jgi:hypothetical protein
MLSVLIFHFTLTCVFLLLINEIDQIFVLFDIQMQFCFLKLVCFLPWLSGRFHNFELTQNRKNKK